MKRLALFALCLFLRIDPATAAGGVVHIADGDCTALVAAANAPAGQEPASIVLARNGHYNCEISVTGKIAIEGSGATWELLPAIMACNYPGNGWFISGSLTLRNINLVPPATAPANDATTQSVSQPEFCHPIGGGPSIFNFASGSLMLDSASVSVAGSLLNTFGGLISNAGTLVLRNVTLTSSAGSDQTSLIISSNTGSAVTIVHSTMDLGASILLYGYEYGNPDVGSLAFANSIIMGTGPICGDGSSTVRVASAGGNLLKDKSCGFDASSDRVASDAGFTDLGRHGGIIDTRALSYFSPAKDIGVAANCEAVDARGVARGQAHCSAGAYEFGGGEGQLSASGASGLYYDAAHDGHYVTVQKLDGGNALVIWNTFNEAGAPAWLYGVGTVDGNTIHVPQVSQNLGGKLQPGGEVVGSKETIWGSFDFTANDCASASLVYHSALPKFGSGSVKLARLALVDGLDCSK